jgi:DNA-directed RNA polymerase specialized sigma24 family protein
VEVAEIMRITVPAVKGRLHRARRDLARALQDPS